MQPVLHIHVLCAFVKKIKNKTFHRKLLKNTRKIKKELDYSRFILQLFMQTKGNTVKHFSSVFRQGS